MTGASDLNDLLGPAWPANPEQDSVLLRHRHAARPAGYGTDSRIDPDTRPNQPARIRDASCAISTSIRIDGSNDQAATCEMWWFPRWRVAPQSPETIPHAYLHTLKCDHDISGRASLGPHLVFQLMRQAEALGYHYISLVAADYDGQAFWAEAGFDFSTTADGTQVRTFARRALAHLQLTELASEVSDDCTPSDIWRIGLDASLPLDWRHPWASMKSRRGRGMVELPSVRTSLGELVRQDADDVLRHRRGRGNRMHVGKALLLLGPPWRGTLQLGSGEARITERWCLQALSRAATTRP